MSRLKIAGTVLAAASLLSGTVALACGDKLLVVGRGVRFQRTYAGHKGNVLIYSTSVQSGEVLKSALLKNTLTRAGHTLQTVDAASQLDAALKSGKVDVVLGDFAELAPVARELQSASSKPVVLPILFKPTKADLAAAQKEYRIALKAPADQVQLLTAIDEAMKLRLKPPAKS
jgi:ABC-type amino acid transport substrate-binding protein